MNSIDNICNCNYYSVGSNLNVSNDSFNLIHINICSANCNLDEFLLNIDKFNNNFQVIALTETFFDSEADWVEIKCYLPYHSIRPKPRGSVGIFVDDSFECNIVGSQLIKNLVIESIGIQLNIHRNKYPILGVYRHLSSSLSVFNL